MTEEEILAMEAGEELDRLTAQNVFGFEVKSWETFRNKPLYQYRVPSQYGEVYEHLPKYSTDTSAAWQVWLAVTKDGPADWAIYSDNEGEVTVEHYPDDYKGSLESGYGDFSVDGQFPEAMCKAALIQNIRKGSDGR